MGESVWRHLSRSRCFSCVTSDHFLMHFFSHFEFVYNKEGIFQKCQKSHQKRSSKSEWIWLKKKKDENNLKKDVDMKDDDY